MRGLSESNRTTPGNKPRRNRSRFGGIRSGATARAGAAFIILALWGVSTLWDIYSTKYDPPEGLNTIALAAATFLFAPSILGRGPDK